MKRKADNQTAARGATAARGDVGARAGARPAGARPAAGPKAARPSVAPRPNEEEAVAPRPPRSNVGLEAALQAQIAGVVEAAGLDLIEFRMLRSGRGIRLCVFVDRLPGKGLVDIEDCATVSRKISTVLEADDPIPGAWDLEVSSPGSKRLLRHAADMERFVGVRARLQLQQDLHHGGGRETVVGDLVAVTTTDASGASGVAAPAGGATVADTTVILDVGGGQQRLIPLKLVQRAHLDPTFEQWEQLGRRAGMATSMDADAVASDETAPAGVAAKE